MSKIIYKLLEQLLGEAKDKAWSKGVEGHAPRPVADKVKQYKKKRFTHVWANATYDMLALIACLDLMIETKVKPLFRIVDQVTLQLEYGANAFSREATQAALGKMDKDFKALKSLRAYCEGIDKAALVLVGRQAALGPFNASNIGFEKAAFDYLRLLNNKAKSALERRIRLLKMIITSNEKILRTHKGRIEKINPKAKAFTFGR